MYLNYFPDITKAKPETFYIVPVAMFYPVEFFKYHVPVWIANPDTIVCNFYNKVAIIIKGYDRNVGCVIRILAGIIEEVI